MKKQMGIKNVISVVFGVFLAAIFVCCCGSTSVYAEDGVVRVKGCRYDLGKGSHYDLEKASEITIVSDGADTYGSFFVGGNIVCTDDIEGVSIYGVSEDVLTFTYAYTDKLLTASNEEWHLVSDSEKKVDGISVDEKIGKGAIIIRTSKDGSKWVDTYSNVNVFEKKPNQTGSFYETTDIQMQNGCYYKIYIVYELEKKNGSKSERKRIAEVYTFYAYDVDQAVKQEESGEELKYCFSERINTGLDNGYSGFKEIDKKDAHFGWNLGEFYVSGYTGQTYAEDGTNIFLENTGDDAVLYFNLTQDIDALNGNAALSISSDDKGYDKYFEIPQTYMGRGTLIVRYTDYENITHDPVIYEDYLSACLSPGADTRIQLYGEGDYEVALDYEIKNDPHRVLGISIFPKYTNYRMFFKFSLRQGKCAVYPMDVVTGSELTNSAYTENGFSIDLAYSRYLEVNVKREVLTSDGKLKVDMVCNTIAKNGSTFTEEGLYTITARNRYTDQTVSKVLYVGNDDLLKAVAKTGLDVSEISELVDRGAVIDKYGNVDVSLIEDGEEIIMFSDNREDPSTEVVKGKMDSGTFVGIITGLVMVIQVLLIVIIMLATNRKRKRV